MMRRTFMAATPAAMIAGASTPARALAETPVAHLFGEWQRLHDQAKDRGLPEEQRNSLVVAELEIEERLKRTPAITMQDLARKALVDMGFGAFGASDWLGAELCSLAGVSSSRMLVPCDPEVVAVYSGLSRGAA